MLELRDQGKSCGREIKTGDTGRIGWRGKNNVDFHLGFLVPPWQGWANLDQAHEDLDRNIFRDLSPTPKP
jgi:hypothetical protein